MPSISIIIPAYNAEGLLTETLESVLLQTFTDWEIVIIDDGSTDGTLALAQRFASNDSRIRVVSQPNAGVAAARNRGLREINESSKAVVLLDHDDLWRADALEKLWTVLEKDTDAIAVHALAMMVNTVANGRRFTAVDGVVENSKRRKLVSAGSGSRVVECSRTEPTTFNVLVYNCCICTPGFMLIRHDALMRLGQFDSDVAPCDDWDMWARLSLLGHIAFLDEVLLNWCVYGGNASLSKERMERGISQLRRKMFTLPGLNPEQRNLAYNRYKTLFASIERHNASDLFTWSRQAASRGEFYKALRYSLASIARYLYYLRLRVLWGPEVDRGPMPRRLKDIATPAELSQPSASSAT